MFRFESFVLDLLIELEYLNYAWSCLRSVVTFRVATKVNEYFYHNFDTDWYTAGSAAAKVVNIA